MLLFPVLRPVHLPLVAAACAAMLAAGLPAGAAAKSSAKTAKIKDPAGDTADGGQPSTDLTGGIAHFRSATGAVSLSLTTSAAIDTSPGAPTVLIQFYDQKCKSPTLLMTATFDSLGTAFAVTAKGEKYGTPILAQAAVRGSTFTFKVKSKLLRKRAYGCADASIVSNDDTPKVYDLTSGKDRFR